MADPRETLIESAESHRSGSAILVVDDDPVYREVLRIALESEGYEVLQAENGARALNILKCSRPDLVILDILMPVMDGLRFLQSLRGDLKIDVPVLVLTCVDAKSVSVEALVHGANDVAAKPVKLESLLGRVRELSARPAAGPEEGAS
jgi:DNA-binding response OmpR family regulator